MDTLELELTYLLKAIPIDLNRYKKVEVLDIYLPKNSVHPKLRLRKKGDKLTLVKKEPLNEGDASSQIEQTIILDEEEFEILRRLEGKIIHKYRYYYPYGNFIAEIDIFLDDLTGLALVDFEFNSEEEKNKFKMPKFCLVDVTQEVFIAGGCLAGKTYKDIKESLKRFNYCPLDSKR
ncbi:MAG: hypothetical protein Q7S44_02995 [bacterium]|nr:hypothetical protein [bacterium]